MVNTRPDMKEAARELVTRNRAAQGLPPKISDPVVLDRVMRLIYSWRDPTLPNEPPTSGVAYRTLLQKPCLDTPLRAAIAPRNDGSET
jgi:hypothetical protein